MPLDRAATLATKELRDRGYGAEIYIASLALEADSLSTSARHWYARWSQSVPIDDRKRELGLRIEMDGSVIRLVEGTSANGVSTAGREALRDHRTRSDRPSILDMKH